MIYSKTFFSVKSLFSFILIICILLATTLSFPSWTCAANNSTIIILSSQCVSLGIGKNYDLQPFTLNGKLPTFTSSNSRIASVDSSGYITGKSPGKCRITARLSSSYTYCSVTVRRTSIHLDTNIITMEHNATFSLKGDTSNGSIITYSSNKKKVAMVDDYGKIFGGIPGEAIITAKADTTKVYCKVIVSPPTVILATTEKSLASGESFALTATVSSGITPLWSSTHNNVATVDSCGIVTAKCKGTTTIKGRVDGVTALCTIKVIS